MSKPTDQDLEKLFKTAKVMRPDVEDLEAGFESRLSARLHEIDRHQALGVRRQEETFEERKETLLSVWAWRLAPVMAIPLLILIIISAVLEFQNSRDLINPIDAYERAQIMMYLTGE